MRFIAFIVSLLVCGTAAAQNPIVYRVQCKPHPSAVADLQSAMAKSLRFFAEDEGIAIAPQSILVKLIPQRANGTVYELRRSDLAGQWIVGESGSLLFLSSLTDRCELTYQVRILGRIGGSPIAGRLIEPIKLSGSYVRTLNTEQRIRLKRKGPRRA